MADTAFDSRNGGVSYQQLNTTDSENASSSLQPSNFSFSKKPMVNTTRSGRCSQISIIHDFPPQRCDRVDHDCDHRKFYCKYRGILKNKDQLSDDLINDLSFDYDYDEKIRAPRMSNLNTFHSSGTSKSGTPDLLSTSEQQRLLHPQKRSMSPAANSSYKPAEFELPERAKSSQDVLKEQKQQQNIHQEAATPEFLLHAYTFRKKSIASSGSSRVSPGKTTTIELDDTSDNETSNNQKYGHVAKQTEQARSSYLSDFKSTSSQKRLRQIDEPSTLPGYIPPVLRAIDKDSLIIPKSTTEKDHNTPSSRNQNMRQGRFSEAGLLSNKCSTANLRLKASSGIVSIEDKLLSRELLRSSSSLFRLGYSSKLEPTHSCWKPNNSSNYCEACKKPFTMVRRRHHCRHCGYLFCADCLQQKANLNLLAKFENPCPVEDRKELCAITSDPGLKRSSDTDDSTACSSNGSLSEQLFKVISHDSTASSRSTSVDYSKFSKVCFKCYDAWIEFLGEGSEFESDHKDLDVLENTNKSEGKRRKSSVAKGVPSDWTWSSF